MVSRTKERRVAPVTLRTRIGDSGLPGATTLRRHGRRLGIETVGDLLTTFPRRYEDLRAVTPIAELRDTPDGSTVTLRATVVAIRSEPTFRRRVARTIARLTDDSGEEVEAVWFGRRYIERRLKAGDRIVASGRLKLRGWQASIDNPEFQPDDAELVHVGRIVPVYRLTRGISARVLRTAIRAGLDTLGPVEEYLTDDVRAGAVAIGEAIEHVHYPEDPDQRDAALDRLAADELLALQLGMVGRRRQRGEARRASLEVSAAEDARIRDGIAVGLGHRLGRLVALTPDQGTTMDDVRRDLAGERPMLRLVQGDVGSGKTAVAAYALAAATSAGGQAALLAPTDLLARQLAATVGDLLDALGIGVTLLTGSLTGAGRRKALEAVANGQARVVVGTHALLQEGVSYARLELVVIDEQHRFGVAQREALAAKGTDAHVLLMTATPIPRTLGQVLYADLDVSDLRTPPEGRRAIATGIRAPSDLDGTWGRVRDEAAADHRTFVVVPHIDPLGSDEPGAVEAPAPSLPADRERGHPAATGAEEVAERLRTQLAPLRVGLVHGRLKAADRDAEMARFRDGELDVLVGTTVVEVGVDVPEATMMIILDADRFGLSQLHQLRGRVGRGEATSFCVLVSDVASDTTARARLDAIAATHDGFVLAEADWELRREGDVLGLSQSGLPRMRVASLTNDAHRELAVRARRQAEDLLDAHGRLRPGNEALADELANGWLARIAAGEADDEGIGA